MIKVSTLTVIPSPPSLLTLPSFTQFIQQYDIKVTDDTIHLPLYWSLYLETFIDEFGRERARITQLTFQPLRYYQLRGPYPSPFNPQNSLMSAINADGKTLKTIGPYPKNNYWEEDNAIKSLIEYLNQEYPDWRDPFAYWTTLP